MRLNLIAGFGLASWIAAGSGPALACSYGGNVYERDQRQSLAQLFRRSTYVERVNVEVRGEAPCPVRPDDRSDDATWDRYFENAPEICGGELPDADLQGRLVERFAGGGEDRFPLRLARLGDTRSWAFGDIRVLSETDRRRLIHAEEERAASRHDYPIFWLQGDVGFDGDGTDSCGGGSYLAPDMDYVVFRNSAGHVVAAEPVSREDDALLVWLRQGNPRDRAFSPQEAFAAASELSVVEVTRCDPPRDEYDEWPYVVWARLVRGERNWSILPRDDPDENGAVETYNLDEWFAFRESPCALGELLVVDIGVSRDGSPYPSRVWTPPTPAVIVDGRVRVADLFPGVTLTGPEWVTVDEAFAWFEAAPTMDDL